MPTSKPAAPLGHERRTFNVKLRSAVAGGAKAGRPLITGYAALFNEQSQDLGGFVEVIRPGAFSRALRTADVRALFNHDDNFVLGRTKSGTLRLEEDDRGLKIEVDPPATTWASDLMVSIERGDVDQMSFAFRVKRDNWTKLAGGQALRELIDVDIFDVSPVTYPAYTQTLVSVDVRNHVQALKGRSSFGRRLEASERDWLASAPLHLRLLLAERGL